MNLIDAARNGDIKTINRLLDEGADLNVLSVDPNNSKNDGRLPLVVAAINSNATGSLETVKLLLERGANINLQEKGGFTALHAASLYSKTNSSVETVRLLLDKGADPNVQDQDGFTPLIMAAQNSNNTSSNETVRLLLDRGANVSIRDKGGFTALLSAARNSNGDSSVETVKILLDRGSDIDSQDNKGFTSLMLAARNSNKDSSVETVKLLLERGANPNLINNNGRSALQLAVKYSNSDSSLETVKVLLDGAADPFVDIECPTATKECEKLIASYRWKLLHRRDIDTAKRYSVNAEIKLPKEVWEIILMNKRQQQLCKNLNNNQNIELLILFAEELGIPIQENMTKGKLCGLISRQLAYGKEEKYRGFAERDLQKYKKDILILARKLGIDTNQSTENILKSLSKII